MQIKGQVVKVQNNKYFIKSKTVILKCIVEWIENISPFVAQNQDEKSAFDMIIEIIIES